MNSVNFSINKEDPRYNDVDLSDRPKHHYLNSGYVKQKLHEKKIDEFFWTDVEAPHKRQSPLAAIGALVGAFAPVVFFAKKQGKIPKINNIKDFGKNIFKNIGKTLNIHYDLKQIISVGAGGVIGGLAGGLLDRKEKHKLEKLEEGAFQMMNVTFPALLVAGSMKMCDKFKFLNNAPSRILASVASILIGANGAVALSNKTDRLFFDKFNHDPDRKLKPKDFVIHLDDFIGTLILAKFPLADKLHMNKILPFVYAWSGYHVGESGEG